MAKKLKICREKPNILITGTPGTGKTTTCELLELATNFKHINVSDLVKEKELYVGKDEDFDAYMVDEDRLCDEIEPLMENGGIILDFHSIDFFPESWIDLVVVLRTDNSILYDRLLKRGYKENKIKENIECEIMQVVLDEANEFYNPEIVMERESNNVDDMERNIMEINEWIKKKN
jgi:adenylate kinase